MHFTSLTRRAFAVSALAIAALGTSACDNDSTTPTPPALTISQTAAGTASLSTLTAALTQAGLVATLNGTGPFTVFAPVNAAFTALPAGVVDNLLASGNSAILTKLLGYHVVAGRFRAADLTNGQVLTTTEGTPLTVTISGGVVRVGGATVTTADVSASNGVVHLIDGVLLGSLDIVDQATVRGFSSLVSAVNAAGLVSALRGGGTNGLTVFAPTNAAFAAIPGGAPTNTATLSNVLQLHVVGARALSSSLTNNQTLTSLLGPTLTIGISGTTITVRGPSNTATVGPADIVAKNGVIHVVNTVLLPTPALTISQTAAATPTLSTLTAALTQAGLVATLNGTSPFTVFAPVNSAFTALPAGVVDNLLASGNAAILTKLLGYHVVAGRFNAASLTNGQVLTTTEGTTLTVTISGGVVRVGGAAVTTADVAASNGVVHLIDGVLLGSLDIVDQATIRGFSSLVNAVSTAGLVTALRGGGANGLTVFAPTNAAFAAIPGGAPTNTAALSNVLQLHVVGARALSSSLTNNQTLTSLLGPTLTIGINGTTITVRGPTNTATVGPADIVAKNGVIHVINAVLLPAPTQTISQLAAATPTLSTLTAALTQAGLVSTLNGTGPFTVFAPVNAAFTALPAGVVDNLLASGNAAILTKLLGYHVVAGRFNAADLTNGQVLTTTEGTTLTVTISGGVVRVGGAAVTTADVAASNGVVHLIDGVLLGSLDIVDQATVRGFSSLVSALNTAGLVTALRGGGTAGLTVFAPTNAAFAAIPGGAPTNATTLSNVLRLHVVGARALSSSLSNNQTLTSLFGPTLTIGIGGTTITVRGPTNTATVGPVDIVAKNGVIHVINAVLLP